MRVAWMLGMVTTSAWAAPAAPSFLDPADAGWRRTDVELRAGYAGQIPPEVMACDFEVYDGLQLLDSTTTRFSRSADDTYFMWSPGALPDAGAYTFRARGRDDAGVFSAWNTSGAFAVDNIFPPPPAPLLVTLDGGFARLTATAIIDVPSGVTVYHFAIGELDPPDGGPTAATDSSYQVLGLSVTAMIGPGRWVPQVHAHDVGGNIGPPAFTPITIAETAGLETPGLGHFDRTQGNPFPRPPLVNVGSPLFVWPAPLSYDAGGYAIVISLADAGRWVHLDESTNPVETLELPGDGIYDVRVAALVDTRVSGWSGSVRVWVDTEAPLTPQAGATVDGGTVTLRWSSVRDRSASTTGSGVREYVARRFDPADAGVELKRVAHLPDASFSVDDAPGLGGWVYRVSAEDNAGNVTTGSVGVSFSDAGAVVTPVDAGPQPEVDAGTVLVSSATVTGQCGAPLVVALTALSLEPGTAGWSLPNGAPEGVTLDPVTGVLRWTPSSAATGVHLIEVEARVGAARGAGRVEVTVVCRSSDYGAKCGCAQGGSALVLVALAFLARRRFRTP